MEISYGHIDGIKIGQIFETRQALIDAGMHPHREAGIWGSSKNAACSIVLSGGYEDDLDDNGQQQMKYEYDTRFLNADGTLIEVEKKLAA